MTPEQFAYWLQGFTELSPDMERPSAAQWQAIKDHLQTVFVKVTPPVGRPADPSPGKLLEEAIRSIQTNPGRRADFVHPGGLFPLPQITC